MTTEENLVVVGKITSVYGIKGWVKVYSWTDPKESIFNYQPWYLESTAGAPELVDIDEYRPQGQGLVAHICGVDDRDEARQYCQRNILVVAQQLPALDAGEYYWHELEGLQVYSSFEQNRQLLGVIGRMMETGANDVMVVEPCEGSIDEQQRLVPFVIDAYHTEVDLQAGTLTLDWDPAF